MKGFGAHILMIEDSQANALTYMRYLRDEGYEIKHVSSGKAALIELNKKISDIVLLDMRLPDMDGIEILECLAKRNLADRVVVMTSQGSINLAVRAMSIGAYDFISKPFARERLVTTIKHLIKHKRQEAILETLESETATVEAVGDFIGSSAVMRALYRTLHNVAASDATVMITGESGTGKELCAKALHELSARRDKPFVALNCAAIPKDLLESEIFGHVKGAFTGAYEARVGAATRADGGVLFFDEICELDIALQAKLLRFVQSSEVQPLGGNDLYRVDIRIVAATNRHPQTEVREGRFREDLFYRLNVIPLHLSPLRNREEDVLEIAHSVLKEQNRKERKNFSGFSQAACSFLLRYTWPGNVRELAHCIQRAVVMNHGDEITESMLQPILEQGISQDIGYEVSPNGSSLGGSMGLPLKPLREVELDYIREAMRVANQSVPQAAALLKISPSTIYRRLKEETLQESEELSG